MFSKSNNSRSCRELEARFEDYLGGVPDPELQAHLAQCERCAMTLEDARFASSLLRDAMVPASEPTQAFLANVMARIRIEEAQVKSPASFWAPLEFLASRVSLSAAVVLLALSVYMIEFAPHRNLTLGSIRTELSASDFPQPPSDPVSNEEVLQSLAERSNGH
ncbi:MAG TPA: hypothetical protein VFE02_07045 [Candidatus Acidoferrales bacterium]|jgi:uncharacterized paraquat-inducible protein A|nr:hypothetical protein [Candidatus Acidoferrales bacterium]